jgi:hypothetical protein
MKDQFTKASSFFQKSISHQLELKLANPIFNATPKRVAILKYVVNQALPGRFATSRMMWLRLRK